MAQIRKFMAKKLSIPNISLVFGKRHKNSSLIDFSGLKDYLSKISQRGALGSDFFLYREAVLSLSDKPIIKSMTKR